MSDLAAIVKSVANDMVHAGEKAGQAFIKHLRDIGSELRASSGLYRDTENGIKDSIGKIGHDVSGDAAHDAGALARDTRGVGAASDGQSLASEEEKALAAREKGADGATDDPVDVVTGEMFLPQEDLALPGVLPLVLGRRHGSAYAHGELFGTRWASTLDQHAVTGLHEIRVALEDGRVLHYPVPGDGDRVMPSHGPRWPLSWDRQSDAVTVEQGDLGQTLHFAARETFGPRRRLLSVTDRAGNEITFTYGDDGVINSVRHSGGYHVKVGTTVTLGGVRVSSLALADPDGDGDIPVREFRYSLSGHLTGVVNASGLPLLFEYDSEGRITRWEDRNGYEYRYTYREDGRVVRGEGTGGFLNVTLDYDLDARTTTVTDALGHETVHHWNDRFQVVRVVDPLGHETRTEKDQYGNVLSVTDELGRTTRTDRDAYGDPVLVTRPDASRVSLAYNSAREPVTATAPDGRTWEYEYGPHGQLTAIAEPTEAVTRYEYGDFGHLTAVIDPQGRTTRVRCNDAGLPVEVYDPLGARTGYARDAFGRVTEVVDSLGAATRLDWGDQDQLIALRRPDGTSETWEYDPEGNPRRHTDPAGQVTSFEYGPFDLPVRRTDPDGAAYRFAYTPQLQLASVTTAQDQNWLYEYDPAGNLIAETDFNGARREYTVDPSGQLVGRTNQTGQETTYRRDVLGRLTERTIGQDLYRYSYDPIGNLTHAEGPDVVLDYVRDAIGRVLAETINGRTTQIRYDSAGRRTSRVTPASTESEWTYDAAGRATQFRSDHDTLEFAYDAVGNETSRRLGPAAALTQSFDLVGRLATQEIWALDHTGDPRHAAQERSYTYGSRGLPVEIRDQLRGTRRFDLDSVGRISQVRAATWHEAYAYDSLGNITTVQTSAAPSGQDTPEDREVDGTLLRRSRNTYYEYDEAGRLTRKTYRTLSGQTRTWTYTWNSEDQLISVTTPSNGTWRYTYDPLGRRIAKRRVRETNSVSGSPATTEDVAEEIWFSWDGPRVAEQTRTEPDGTISIDTWEYRPGDFTPVAQISRTLAGLENQQEIDRRFFAIVTDLIGTPQELVTPEGTVAWHTTTTIWGETIATSGSEAECPLRFPGQYHDEETGLHYNLNRYYDPVTGRYLSIDPLGITPAPNPSIYVGNPFTEADPLGLAPYTQVEYGGDNLSRVAIAERKKNSWFNRRNTSVYEYKDANGSLKHVTLQSGGRHAERKIMDALDKDGVGRENITRIYTELEPCGPDYHNCYAWLDKHAEKIPVDYSFKYGPDKLGRKLGINSLGRAVTKIRQGYYG